MLAVAITKHGNSSVLQVPQRPNPPPRRDRPARVTVRAAGVNFANNLIRIGLYTDAAKLPSVVGYKVARSV